MSDRGSDRRRYWGDVVYEVWRNGGDSDRVDRDRTDDWYDRGLYPEDAAVKEVQRQRPQRDEYPPEDYPIEEFPPEEEPE